MCLSGVHLHGTRAGVCNEEQGGSVENILFWDQHGQNIMFNYLLFPKFCLLYEQQSTVPTVQRLKSKMKIFRFCFRWSNKSLYTFHYIYNYWLTSGKSWLTLYFEKNQSQRTVTGPSLIFRHEHLLVMRSWWPAVNLPGCCWIKVFCFSCVLLVFSTDVHDVLVSAGRNIQIL